MEAESGRERRLRGGDRALYACALDARGRRAANLVASPTMPGDVFLVDVAAGSERRLTEPSRDLFEVVWLFEPRRFTALSADGAEVEGWAMPPFALTAGGRVPAALEIHGGRTAKAYFHEFRALARAGYGLVYGNQRGSAGCGQACCQAIQFAWGDRDYADVIALMDTALAENAWIDPGRLGVLAGSYGG